MLTRPGFVGLLLLVALAIGAIGLTASAQRPTASRPVSAFPRGDDVAYVAALAPRVAAAADQARALAALGERRSRNLLEIRSAQSTMESALAAVEKVAAARPVPTEVELALEAYRTGAAAVRTAMSEARAGFLRFDWDRVAAANEQMASGAERLNRAARLLEDPPPATPVPADEG